MIDYLKVDIEKSEVPAFFLMLRTGSFKDIKQIGFEVIPDML